MPNLSEAQKEQIRQEARKELARRDFWDFCVYMDPVFFTDNKPHLKRIAHAFQQVYKGKIKKLAVSMPPRAGKSYITSLFCAFMLGHNPDGSIMRNSYAAKLAEKFSKDLRDGIIPSDKYKNIFPGATLSKTSTAVDGWCLGNNTQPAYFCAGVGGPITGFGCKTLAILDDPIKNIEEALSETIIENVWNWYTSTHLSRLETDCPEIHIATRWSRKDPIGRLTDISSVAYSDEWTVISIPALTDDGKSFCEEIKTTEEYYAIRKVTEEFIWEAEFMQNPVESKGLLMPIEELNRFKLHEIKSKNPDGIVGYTDTADQGADYLCSVIGKKYSDFTYITDVIFTQEGVEITEPFVAQMIIDTKCDIMRVESNNGGKSFAQNVQKLIKGQSGCSVIFEPTTANKETRILMNAGYIKNNFYFRDDYEPGSDYDKFMRQMTSYVKIGKNKHDDANDGITGLAEYVKKNLLFPRPTKPLPGKFYTPGELEDLGYKTPTVKKVN
ncbi:MAG TPA: phage terminase large subunit [Flavobacterium sp.]|nr:phage terminase large subunit [Flavobacterium sp.]